MLLNTSRILSHVTLCPRDQPSSPLNKQKTDILIQIYFTQRMIWIYVEMHFVHIDSLKKHQMLVFSSFFSMYFIEWTTLLDPLCCSAEAADVLSPGLMFDIGKCDTLEIDNGQLTPDYFLLFFFFLITNNNTAHITRLKEECWQDAWYLWICSFWMISLMIHPE